MFRVISKVISKGSVVELLFLHVFKKKIFNPCEDVHLTNVAIQKNAPDYDPDKGCKWSTQQLRKYLSAKHGVEAVRTEYYHHTILFYLNVICSLSIVPIESIPLSSSLHQENEIQICIYSLFGFHF